MPYGEKPKKRIVHCRLFLFYNLCMTMLAAQVHNVSVELNVCI